MPNTTITTETNNLVVDSDELVFLDSTRGLPFVKCIELVKYTPRHFELDKWQPTFVLPNSWMQKIYKHDVYHDTDDPNQPETEKFSPRQIKIINDYVQSQRRMHSPHEILDSRLRGQLPPVDCLSHYLEMPSFKPRKSHKSKPKPSTSRIASSGPLSPSNDDNIAILYSHKIQPEEKIVKIALDKMKRLDSSEEEKYQRLLKDTKFMERLNVMVRAYLKLDQTDRGLDGDGNSTDYTETA